LDGARFYEPIPDVEAYLARIGVKRQEPSREYLDALVHAHQCTIPFETLDVTDYHRLGSLHTADLFDKVITRKRGGYCFELNGLFVLLLQALGFDAYSCPCRMLMHNEPVSLPATHRANMVRLDQGLLYCDVGFGGPVPSGSLNVANGPEQTIRGETFWFRQESAYWYTLLRKTSKKVKTDAAGLVSPESHDRNSSIPLLSVSPADWLPVDFYGPNLVRSAGDTAFPVRTVTLRRSNGYIALVGNLFTETKDGVSTRRSVTEAEAAEILRTRFLLTPEQ